MTAPDRLFWLDIETTGLNPARDLILEVAVAVTGPDLETIDEFHAVIGDHDGTEVRRRLVIAGEKVIAMHTDSRLLGDLEHGDRELDVRAHLAGLADQHKGALLAGSGVHFDRGFIATAWGIDTLGPLHYRNFDVSTLRTFTKLYQPDAAYEQRNTHRAMDDVQDAIAELRHYQAVLGGVKV